MNAKYRNISKEISNRGYVFLPEYKSGETSTSALESIGSLEKVAQYDEIHKLVPKQKAKTSKNTYSKNFGYKDFPLHTDFAHWHIPPKYLVLRCISGARNVVTRILSVCSLLELLEVEELSRVLVQPRKSIDGQRPLLRLLDNYSACLLFRWDNLFLVASTAQSKVMLDKIEAIIKKMETTNFTLKSPGDTLIIDNWRFLHGRSHVPRGDQKREIHRAYLTSIK